MESQMTKKPADHFADVENELGQSRVFLPVGGYSDGIRVNIRMKK